MHLMHEQIKDYQKKKTDPVQFVKISQYSETKINGYSFYYTFLLFVCVTSDFKKINMVNICECYWLYLSKHLRISVAI